MGSARMLAFVTKLAVGVFKGWRAGRGVGNVPTEDGEGNGARCWYLRIIKWYSITVASAYVVKVRKLIISIITGCWKLYIVSLSSLLTSR